MKKISLTRGMSAQVDDGLFEWLNTYKWYALSNNCGNFYAARDVRFAGQRKTVLMHRVVLRGVGILDGEHKDGNGLNNQLDNFRPATRSQNHANRKRLRKDKSAPFRGVSLCKRAGKYSAQISIENKKKHLGLFSDPTVAAHAYDKAARKQFGAFANLNFPTQTKN